MYYEIEVSTNGEEVYYNMTPAHVATPRISRKRPRREDPPYKDPYWIELYRGGVPASIYVGDETHHPNPPPPDPHGQLPGSQSSMGFGVGGSNPVIPAEFFGPGSDPFDGVIYLYGEPVNLFTQGDASSLFQRWGEPVSPDAPVGSNGTVDLEIIELNLVSVAPITVTYSTGPDEEWDVAVGLSVKQPFQETGYLTATKTHENGGVFDTWLTVQPKLTFRKVGEPEETRVLDAGLEERPPLVFESMDTPWVHEVDPNLDILAPDDGLFVPMVNTTGSGSQELVEMIAQDLAAPASHPMYPATSGCITLEQFAEFVTCLAGPADPIPNPENCSKWDGNDSGHVDLGDFALVQKNICMPSPNPGDDCGDPVKLTLPEDIPYSDSNTTCGRLDDYYNTCLGSYDEGEDIIYELNVTDATDVDITLDPYGTPDTGIAIGYEGECPPGDPCMEYSIGDATGIPHGIECLHLEPGVYHIMIDIQSDPLFCFDFGLTIEESVLPDNDDCINAEMVGDVVDQPFNTTCATVDGPGMCMSGPNIWYCYQATCPGYVTVSLCGSDYDTVLGVFHTCSCDPVGPMIDCNDNYCGLQSQVTFPAGMGEMYLIEVGGNGSNTGEGVLTIYCELP